jgi:hypothetical protein
MQAEYATGSKAPELTFGKSSVGYAQVRSIHAIEFLSQQDLFYFKQTKRVVMQSVMRSSKVTSSGMTKR